MHLVAYLWGIQVLLLAPFVVCYYHRGQRSYSPKGSTKCKADANEPWSYRGKNSPIHWGERFPECNGEEQSPIAINSRNVFYDGHLAKLSLKNYDRPVTSAAIVNTGRTVEVTPRDGVERSIYVKGSMYRLMQLHFHWGDSHYRGSEHTLDGTQYSMELHLVHRNVNNDVAVVAILFQEQQNKNAVLQTVINEFPSVLFRDMRGELKSSLKLNNLLPANPSSFYRYTGSLTTPECTEGVIWSVLTKPMAVGKYQMAEFRKLFSARKADATPSCKLSGNFRPLQPLNYRKVYKSQ